MKLVFTEQQPLSSKLLAALADFEITDDRDADVLWVGLSRQIDYAFLSRYRNVKVVCSPTTGLDHVDESACQLRGISVISLKGDTEFLRTVPATAELTICLMLALLRKIPAAIQHVQSGGWNRNPFQGRDLSGMVVGIVGMGRIGSQVKRLVEAFGAKAVENHQLADIVSVHLPLSRETHGMFGSQMFASFRRGALFINTSRGEIVDESALLNAMKSGHLAGAALDVVCNERGERNPRLMEFARENPDRLIVTPHIGGNTVESRERTDLRIAEKLAAWKFSKCKQIAIAH